MDIILDRMVTKARRRREELSRYVEVVGREPRNLPEDHPERWQWEYLGRSDEDKERLQGLIQSDSEPPVQEVLF